MSRLAAVLLLCFLVPAGGCLSVSETKLDGSGLEYPVSMSQSIVDAAGQIYKPTESEVVSHFRREWTHWGWFYGQVSLSSDVELAAVLHEEIEKANGDGVVNLKFQSNASGFSWFVSLLIIFPEWVEVVMEGDVIRRSSVGK